MALVRIGAALTLLGLQHARACTIMAAGKDASAYGAPIVGHSEDAGQFANDVRFVRVPHKKWPAGSRRPLYKVNMNYPRLVDAERSPEYAPVDGQSAEKDAPALGYIDQVPETFAYWDTGYGVQNERGLSIAESTCTANTIGWPANLPYGHNKLGIEELSNIALERCETAKCAVQLMGDLAVEHGFYGTDGGDPSWPQYQASSECLTLADAVNGELWLFNVLTGANNRSAIWAAQRVPSNAVVAVANTFTIRKMNLSDPENFLYSPDIQKLAVEKGWWSPKQESSPEIFDFFNAYGYTPGILQEEYHPPNIASILAFYSGRRMWRIYSLLVPEEGAKLDPERGNLPKTQDPYPPFVTAKPGSITLPMVLSAYRDHYEGTPYDLTKGIAAGPHGNPNRPAVSPFGMVGQWERALGIFRTTWSFVNIARPAGKSIVWFSWDAAHGSVYLPFYGAASRGGPEGYHSTKGNMAKFSFDCAWTPFAIVNTLQDICFDIINAEVSEKYARIEADAMQRTLEWEAEADKAGSPEEAAELLTERSNAFAEATVKEWWEFALALFPKYKDLAVTWNDTQAGENYFGQQYPDWWLRTIGFDSWTPSGPNFVYLQGAVPEGLSAAGYKAAVKPFALAAEVPGLSSSNLALGLLSLCLAVGSYALGLRQGSRQRCDDVYIAHP